MATYTSLSELGRVQQGVETTLFTDEEFLGAIDTWHLFRFITKEILILTDQRVILYKKGFIKESTTDFDRDQIANVSFDKGLFRRKLTVNGTGYTKQWRVPYSGGKQFASAMRAPDPQPVYPQDTTAKPTSEPAESLSTGDFEAVQITESEAEQFGFDRWHYLTAAGLVLMWITLAADFSGLFPLLLILTGVGMYLDILLIRKASTWSPRAWLYEIGLLVLGIGAAVYLFNRYRVMSQDTDAA